MFIGTLKFFAALAVVGLIFAGFIDYETSSHLPAWQNCTINGVASTRAQCEADSTEKQKEYDNKQAADKAPRIAARPLLLYSETIYSTGECALFDTQYTNSAYGQNTGNARVPAGTAFHLLQVSEREKNSLNGSVKVQAIGTTAYVDYKTVGWFPSSDCIQSTPTTMLINQVSIETIP